MHTVHFNLQKQNWKDWLVNIGAYIYYSFTTFGCIFMLVNASLCKVSSEKKINEDIHQCKGQITCNIGRIIDEIRNDDGK